MAKVYVDTLKYIIRATIEIDGVVEKPDVVGAIFGQTEGLLGEELDLRELQKSGRIGRIDVDIESKEGKSTGSIVLPSSLDRVETSLLAAALESVDRVGPCEAKIRVTEIIDTRATKREQVVDRAKDILKVMMSESIPESKEISKTVREEVKTAEIQFYGKEKLAAGPNVRDADSIIVVEGRADVINLLRADIKNVIALQGKNIPKSVIDLSKEKSITVFVDGDRGGDLIVKRLSEMTEVDFVAKAPEGKEVEELTQKELIKCLRKKVPLDQFMAKSFASRKGKAKKALVKRAGKVRPFLKQILKRLEGSLRAVMLDKDGKEVAEVDVRDLATEMEKQSGVHTVILDGIVTQRLVDVANAKGVSCLVGIKHGKIKNLGRVKVITCV